MGVARLGQSVPRPETQMQDDYGVTQTSGSISHRIDLAIVSREGILSATEKSSGLSPYEAVS